MLTAAELGMLVVHNQTTHSLEKNALTVEEGGPVSRVVASTLGRLNPLSLPTLLLTTKAYTDPSRDLLGRKDNERMQRHEDTAKLIEKYDPEALKDTVLRLGGVDVMDDYFYQKDRGRKLPWYNRVGGRLWQNPKTSIIGKTLATMAMPYLVGNAVLNRGSNYNSFTDVANVYQDEQAITEHELGHALDINKLYGLRPGAAKDDSLMGRAGQELKGAARDAYMLAYSNIPGFNLLPEARANIESQKALDYALKDNPKELKKRNINRLQVLPAGYGSYVGNVIPGLGIVGSLAGMAAGKGLGLASAETYRAASNDSKPSEGNATDTKKKKKPQEKEAAMTQFELGMLAAQKQAEDTGLKRKAKSDAAEYKEMTKDIPAEFKGIRDDMHSFLKETDKRKKTAFEIGCMSAIEKSAFFGFGKAKPRKLDYGPFMTNEDGEVNDHLLRVAAKGYAKQLMQSMPDDYLYNMYHKLKAEGKVGQGPSTPEEDALLDKQLKQKFKWKD